MFHCALPKLHLRIFHRSLSTVVGSLRTLEVERKFTPTKKSIIGLVKNEGLPPFESNTFVSRYRMKDLYYESSCRNLMKNGIYVRKRNGALEAKIRQRGDYTNTEFIEVKGEEEVSRVIASAIPDKHTRLEDLDLHAWMETVRFEWKLNGFNVVIDTTRFGDKIQAQPSIPQTPHLVGEVELWKYVEDGYKGDMGKELDERIEAFMEKHEWAFPVSDKPVVGKLLAFDKWVESQTQ